MAIFVVIRTNKNIITVFIRTKKIEMYVLLIIMVVALFGFFIPFWEGMEQ